MKTVKYFTYYLSSMNKPEWWVHLKHKSAKSAIKEAAESNKKMGKMYKFKPVKVTYEDL